MAYNISVKFKDFPDRWRWVERGIELLRDEGLRYNPDDVLIHRGAGLVLPAQNGREHGRRAICITNSNGRREMMPFFGPNGTNFSTVASAPNSRSPWRKCSFFTNKYKLDPAFAEKVNAEWGPLDWRLPEAHAIYWAALGLERGRRNIPTR